jgi:diguanylate cyclase (GGDEF)-like protein
VAARYGGEEFVLVLPGTPESGGLVVAERLREAVQALSFAPPMKDLSVTISLGLATYPSPLVDSVNTLFCQADYALYRAKHNGRNRVEKAEETNT